MLDRSQEFLLNLHASHDPAELRTRITDGLARLIACDRISFNEADLSRDLRKIVPTPTPSWWPRFGEVYLQHMFDHPAWSREYPPPLLHTIALDDAHYARTWRKSTLRNEYFLPLDVTHQLSARVHEQGNLRAAISLNRHRRGFSPQERALVDLLNPHVAQAWRNALLITTLHEKLARAETEPSAAQAVIAVDARRGTVRSLSPSASHLLRRYFGADSAAGGRLPGELARWLRAQQTPTVADPPAVPLVVYQPAGRLAVSLALTRPEEVILLLQDCGAARPARGRRMEGLSPREGEILGWIIEGKRNSEIAVILGISLRTVEKHMEHILGKLGVETRSAAVRLACEILARRDD
jgi:DNA-binding CsgD family transcriptional regulator